MTSNNDISLRIVLDEQKHYFPGDKVRGRLILKGTQPFASGCLRLIWSGSAMAYCTNDHNSVVYFEEIWQLDSSRHESENGWFPPHSWVLANNACSQNGLDKHRHAQYYLMFELIVPLSPLPSSTEIVQLSGGGRITYTIQGLLFDQQMTENVLRTQVEVPVVGSNDEQIVPQWSEALYNLRFSHLQGQQPSDSEVMMKVAMPFNRCPRGSNIPITIYLHSRHNAEVKRKEGVSVSLVRTCSIHAKDRAHELPDQAVETLVMDVDLRRESNYTQILPFELPIPRTVAPSVGANARIMEIRYKINVRVRAYEAAYQLSSDEHYILPHMTVDLPFIIDVAKETKKKRGGLFQRQPKLESSPDGSRNLRQVFSGFRGRKPTVSAAAAASSSALCSVPFVGSSPYLPRTSSIQRGHSDPPPAYSATISPPPRYEPPVRRTRSILSVRPQIITELRAANSTDDILLQSTQTERNIQFFDLFESSDNETEEPTTLSTTSTSNPTVPADDVSATQQHMLLFDLFDDSDSEVQPDSPAAASHNEQCPCQQTVSPDYRQSIALSDTEEGTDSSDDDDLLAAVARRERRLDKQKRALCQKNRKHR